MVLKQIWVLVELCPVKGVCVQPGVSCGWAGIERGTQHPTVGHHAPVWDSHTLPTKSSAPVQVQSLLEGDLGS